MALTNEQQSQLDILTATYNNAVSTYNSLVAEALSWKQKAEACQAARDTKTTGWAKNNACPIDGGTESLSYYNDMWRQKADARDVALVKRDSAKKALDDFQAELDQAISQAQQAALADPAVLMQSQELAAQALYNEGKRANQQKIVLFIIGGVIVLVIAGIVIWKFVLRK